MLNTNKGNDTLLKMALRRQGDYSLRSLFDDLGIGAKYDQVIKELEDEGGSAFQAAVKELLTKALSEGIAGGIGGKGSTNVENLLKTTG